MVVLTMNQIYVPVSQVKISADLFAPAGMLVGRGGSIVMRGQLAPEQMADQMRTVVRSPDPQLPLTLQRHRLLYRTTNPGNGYSSRTRLAARRDNGIDSILRLLRWRQSRSLVSYCWRR